ncbi:MAG: Tim44 domain-containing protein [Thermodesulfobacteriota bacterium]
MLTITKYLSPLFLVLMALTLLFDAGLYVDDAEARSRGGGRSFSRSRPSSSPSQTTTTTRPRKSGSFAKGMAGGLLGGAIGGMLFGSLFGGAGLGGSGLGLLQILIFGGIFYFIFKKITGKKGRQPGTYAHQQQGQNELFSDSLSGGLAQIRQSEPGFDSDHFSEVAQDVFFKVQAGWMRREIDSFKHLLGSQLAAEYEGHFQEMREKGEINKLENISVRGAQVEDAGVDGNEEFVAVRFTANLLDYTVDDQEGKLIRGSMTEPVKFNEKWTWARPVGSKNWLLEGIA